FHPSAFPTSSSFFFISFFILFAAAKHTQVVNQHQLRQQMKSGNREADASDEEVYEGVRCGRYSHMRPTHSFATIRGMIARGNLRNQNFGGPTVTLMTASNFQCHRVPKCSQLCSAGQPSLSFEGSLTETVSSSF
ncbi:hypothetical protein EDB83DRAFT_2448224, partial [Lactarius deliciosus]